MRRLQTDAPFVHVGRAGDPDLRWLVGAPLPPEPCAYLLCNGEPTLYVSESASVVLTRAMTGRVETTDGDPAVALADALPGSGVVRAPRHLPHDAALRVEQSGHDLRSTTAVADARTRKDEAERAALTDAAQAAREGVECAREVLTADGADAPVVPGDDGTPGERLRRRVASAVASAGATPSVRVDGVFQVGSPVVVDTTARVAGYHARVARTLVVGGDGGAVRRAQVAAESALRVAAGEATPETDVDWLADEVRAELGSFGVDAVDGVVVAGTGLARREAPLVGTDATLDPGSTLVVAPAARVPEGEEVVRVANTLVVGEEGAGARVLGRGSESSHG